jgi:hypothetical protein
MNLLEALVRGAADREDEPKKTRLPPDVAEMRLREASLRFTRANPFKVGDWVTPASDSILMGVGTPHMVVETRDHPAMDTSEAAGSRTYGYRADIRVICVSPTDKVASFWVESCEFDRYEPTKAS